jgi:hypothetical protein
MVQFLDRKDRHSVRGIAAIGLVQYGSGSFHSLAGGPVRFCRRPPVRRFHNFSSHLELCARASRSDKWIRS